MSRRQQYRTAQAASRNGGKDDALSLLHSFDNSVNPSRPVKSSPLGSSTIAGLPLELLDRLKAFPLFQSAPESFLLSIGKSLRPSVYQPSQEIIREGEDARAMYWLVRGSVRVTSRDGESTYAELKPGSFFGEIGILMDIPRTASIVASTRSLAVRLNKEDLQKELPTYPHVESTIREEALERLAILESKKKQRKLSCSSAATTDRHGVIVRPPIAPRKRSRDWAAGDVEMGDAGSLAEGDAIISNKRRKSPSPGLAELAAGSTLDSTPLTVRQLLKELPLFSSLPNDILHFLGTNAQPITFAPFTEILAQGSTGRDVYFIIKGEVEVLTTAPDSRRGSSETHSDVHGDAQPRQRVRARLKTGQYFGEVTSLSLAPRRTATVRSVDAVECLLINGEVLDELWRRCSFELRQQVESEAKRRLEAAKTDNDDDDVVMTDAEDDDTNSTPRTPTAGHGGSAFGRQEGAREWSITLPTVKFDTPDDDTQPLSSPQQMEPIDPDPFFSASLDNLRTKSRRSSLAPPLPGDDAHEPLSLSIGSDDGRAPSPASSKFLTSSPLRPKSMSRNSSAASTPTSPSHLSPATTRRPSVDRRPSNQGKGKVPDQILTRIFQFLTLPELMRLRLVSLHWMNLLTTSPELMHSLNLSLHNKHITDEVLRDIVVPFVGSRPKEIDMSNCFHITDEGFKYLVEVCGEGARTWKMKSVWDVSGPAVLSLVERAKALEEIDLSNCRKVGDNLLARVVGWVVPENPGPKDKLPPPAPVNGKRPNLKRGASSANLAVQAEQPIPGTVIGAPLLRKLTLSYCKHVQDRSMAHIAVHAADRLESLDLTRCTSISDAGFHSWSHQKFTRLNRLVLADCTYLSDQAIVGIVGGCRGLQHLDLSFCCALSDTATEVLSLGLPNLRSLNMAFCGSAVSDNSLRCIGLHLLELRYLSVRGCVRVTGQGTESIVEGCRHLEVFDVSQCKNLRSWLDRGGVRKVNAFKERHHQPLIHFGTVADGTWRVGR
ncbi:RNI-like protein [Polychaeton citri CBS 116435]|uniref:RNI-like protein n=1 Tax=Polychaeton citri CBS 116435 TaxID=1314669 RepID=A0A9P4UQE3_9PEZI|nr:RNI-like protein [Polychaeton citri CBS 116435]